MGLFNYGVYKLPNLIETKNFPVDVMAVGSLVYLLYVLNSICMLFVRYIYRQIMINDRAITTMIANPNI